MLLTPLRQHLQTVKFGYSSLYFLSSALPFYKFLNILFLSGRQFVHLVLPTQCLWPSLGDLVLSRVRWKGSLTWNQMLLRLLFNPLPTQRATLLALLSSCPSSQKRYLHIPEKEDPIMNRSCAKQSRPCASPERSSCVWRVYFLLSCWCFLLNL